MCPQDQLELEQSATEQRRPGAVSGVKTILLHVQDNKSLEMRIDSALSLARACGAHLSCVHVTPIEAYVAFDNFGGVFVMNDVITALDAEEQAIRTKIEQDLQNEDVSWDYVQVTGNVAGQLVRHAALADLVVTGREPHRADFGRSAIRVLGDILYRARTPLFIPGDNRAPADPAGIAMIAWDGSYEAANTVRSSIGLLKLASNIQVVQIIDEAKKDAFPGTRLLEYMSRHGIHAELSIIEAGVDVRDDEVISATLVARAVAIDASYMLLGAYSRSRIGEYVFGGVTRSLLGGCPVPLLMAH
jgi:nucleotide-binding universal stress UspA family protein